MENKMEKLNDTKEPPKVDCPTCKIQVSWSETSSYRPFCSLRCKQIDLGEWASEGFSIPGPSAIKNHYEMEDDTTHH
jgi:endogenous inhibitor of DNA gyrase (YacG/DUF329 family)|tara:strand:+ start:3570 stop:3800 length:231 start_codon:yes stop_codon:yes gene_type:complete